MSATQARITQAKDFDLCGMRVIVAEIEGTVQLMFCTDGWPEGRRKVMANVFAHDTTPAELRALADHLETLPLEAATVGVST
jgi:hypothetical protein